ncbi:MAG: 2-oxoacid:acceptor oxidoreductase family protein [Elusimicrobia bacterium]|nr:2-oxoacid:acceptor oxidoreductase family protein [Candidatus Obscuribacterium magneticum]
MDKRFLKEDGDEVFTGNELLLKGALEGGAALITGYPGSPVSEVFDAISVAAPLLIEKGIVAQMANNEALSAARLNGARLADLRAMSLMKSVGLHVAADGLAVGNLAEPRKPGGGALVVSGDDPWNETTQINSDSRFLFQHLNMPVLEPATFQEIKDWIKDGFELSGLADLYMGYVITTNQADGGGTVKCRPNLYPVINRHQKTVLASDKIAIADTVMIPPHTSWREATLADRQQRLLAGARQRGLNKIFWPTGSSEKYAAGFVTSGLSYCYLVQALREMGLEGGYPILKWGLTYPLDETILLEFAARVGQIVVVEEKRGFVETQMVNALQKAVQSGRLAKAPAVWGKRFPEDREGIPAVRGINASVLIERLSPLLKSGLLPVPPDAAPLWNAALKNALDTAAINVSIPARTPTFCPGCPHRDSSSVTKEIKKNFLDPVYMKGRHASDPVDVIFHGESGCHSMLQFEPNVGLMQNYSGMGLGGGTGAGIDPFVQNKQVVFVGDSTFFHSGMLAVSDAIKNHQDITFIILENKTTAMTGHQPMPGNDIDVLYQKTFAQDIEHVIRGMARDSVPVLRVNPGYRDSYLKLLEDVILKDGVKVVIADKECGITYQRRVRRERKRVIRLLGYLPEEKVINVTPEVCEFCLECTQMTGCPGLTIDNTLHGPKIVTDKSLCIADGACTKGKVCPSFEEVTIKRRAAPAPLPEPRLEDLPEPVLKTFDDVWYGYTAGVGGMGAGIVTAVLVRAGILQGYQTLFADKKGLAIRNGSVFGHVIFSKKERIFAPLVPYGKADLLLGIDLLESARGLDPKLNLRIANPSRTVAVVNTHKVPTVRTLLGLDDFNPEELAALIRQRTRADRFLGLDFANVSEEYFGNKLYANVLLLGAAFQRGLLPVSYDNLVQALRETIPSHELEENLRAIRLGRQIAHTPDAFMRFAFKKADYWKVVDDNAGYLQRGRLLGKWLSREYRKLVEDTVRWVDLDEPTHARLAQFLYDLIQFEGISYARRYAQKLWTVYKKDQKNRGFAATRAVLENLYRVMLIKDEVYVAHLLTSEEKFRRDNERYRLDPFHGDTADYVHINRPRFAVFGKNVEFDIRTRNWQLRIMKHLRFLRRMMTGWHVAEKEFRAWYENLVDGFNIFDNDETYRFYTEALRQPEQVRGYREIRYPKMLAARRRAAELLAQIREKRPADSVPARKN